MRSDRLGWLVIESTTRDGCDVDSTPQQFWTRDDADAAADSIRRDHADDDAYTVEVRRETVEDAAQYGRYV